MIREIEAKKLLTKHNKIDSWFLSHYSMNIYRGCGHNCLYCDGRSEEYYADGEFGEDIVVKVNAPEILNRELDPERRRIPLKKSYLLLGGGVGDCYQDVDIEYQLTRQILEIIEKYEWPVHILTKSTLVLRDLDIIKRIHEKSGAIVSFSFSSVNENLGYIFESGVPTPKERLKAISKLRKAGIPCGMFLMPVLPFISDTPGELKKSLKAAHKSGVEFVIFSGMTLKDGRQKDCYYELLNDFFPHLIPEYDVIYQGNRWGEASESYYRMLNLAFYNAMKKFKIPKRIPRELFQGILNENDYVSVLLEHIDHYLTVKGEKAPFSFAARTIAQLEEPVSEFRNKLQRLQGVSPTAEQLILDILDYGTCQYYEMLVKE